MLLYVGMRWHLCLCTNEAFSISMCIQNENKHNVIILPQKTIVNIPENIEIGFSCEICVCGNSTEHTFISIFSWMLVFILENFLLFDTLLDMNVMLLWKLSMSIIFGEYELCDAWSMRLHKNTRRMKIMYQFYQFYLNFRLFGAAAFFIVVINFIRNLAYPNKHDTLPWFSSSIGFYCKIFTLKL